MAIIDYNEAVVQRNSVAVASSTPWLLPGVDSGEFTPLKVDPATGGLVTISSLSSTTNIPATSVVGGVTTYSNAYGDFQVTVAGWNKEVVVSWLPFILTAETIMWWSAKVQDNTGVVSVIPMTAFTLSGSTITFTDKTDNFASDDIVSLYLAYQQKGFSSKQDSQKNIVQNPIGADYNDVEETTETNLAVNNYFKLIPNSGKRILDLQLVGSTGGAGVVFKIYETLDPNATVTAIGGTPDTTVWTDVSTSILGGSTITIDGGNSKTFHKTPPSMPEYYMIEYDIDNATNSTTIRSRIFN